MSIRPGPRCCCFRDPPDHGGIVVNVCTDPVVKSFVLYDPYEIDWSNRPIPFKYACKRHQHLISKFAFQILDLAPVDDPENV